MRALRSETKNHLFDRQLNKDNKKNLPMVQQPEIRVAKVFLKVEVDLEHILSTMVESLVLRCSPAAMEATSVYKSLFQKAHDRKH